MTQAPQVAVIIVNYNGYALTRHCLASFSRLTDEGSYVLIVVDNASVDDSLALLRPEFPRVRFVESDTNLGFTGGNNLGLSVAYDLGAQYVFFLNNDTVVSENILELADFLELNPDVGMVAPLTFYYDHPELVSFGGGELDRNTGRITFLNKGITRDRMPAEVIWCSFLEGAAIMARAELVRRAGGFNDDYFLNSEEAELCVKIADLGYRLALVSSCSVWHKVSQTMGTGSELLSYFVYRNRLRFIRNNARRLGFKEIRAIVHNYLASYLSLLIKSRNFAAARGLLHGVADFAAGVTGVGRYRDKLQPGSTPGSGKRRAR